MLKYDPVVFTVVVRQVHTPDSLCASIT